MAVILSERAQVRRDGRLRPKRRPSHLAVGPVLDRAARTAGQVAMFGVIGLYGAAIGASVLPLARILERDPVRRAGAVRRIVSSVCRSYVESLRKLRLIDLEAIGMDRPWAPGTLIVANHPSLIDALVLLGCIDRGVVVAKRSLQINPVTWGSIRGANYVVNTEAQALVGECCARVAAGELLILFPECTRTASDGVIRLRRGAAQIAVRSNCPVVPVTLEFSEPLLTKQSRWWLAPKSRPRVRVVRHDPIDPAQFLTVCEGKPGKPSLTLAARRLNEHLQTLYVKELGRSGSA